MGDLGFFRLVRRSIFASSLLFIGRSPLFHGSFFSSFAGLLFFRTRETFLGRRASSNIRSRSAARPPGGSGVLSPGRLVMVRSEKYDREALEHVDWLLWPSATPKPR